MSRVLDFFPTQTLRAWIKSDAFLTLLRGPRGEGKSTGAIYRLISKATSMPPEARPFRVAVVRDTYESLLRTVVDCLKWEQRYRGLPVAGLDSKEPKGCVVAGLVELLFFGMDSLPDANKFQSLNLGGLWIEEAAPAADLTSGVPAEVLALGITSLRQPGAPHLVQITENPPDEEHWTERLVETLQAVGGEDRMMSTEVFDIPPGENPHLPLGYRERNREALEAIGRHDLVVRLVEGRTGPVALGPSVTPSFNAKLHVAEAPLPFLRGVPSYLFFDFGRNPTALLLQHTPLGYLHVLASWVGEDTGLEEHLHATVIPYLLAPERRAAMESCRWRAIGDPAGESREQSHDVSAVSVLLRELKFLRLSWEPGPIDWDSRRNAWQLVLSRMLRGKPLVQIDPGPLTKAIRKSLDGGWHYPQRASGKIEDQALKDFHSHSGDAGGYGFAVLYAPILRKIAEAQRKPDYPGYRDARLRQRVPMERSYMAM